LNKPHPIGINWVSRFVNWHETLKSKYSCKYNYERAQCEDPEVIRAWFERVHTTITKYGIALEDIYNFDETGFQLGVATTAKVITSSEKRGRPWLTQLGNREWVTTIETINAHGWALPPIIIFKGKYHQSQWYEGQALPSNWVITLSDSGWTNDELGLAWLKEVFDKHTKSRTIGRYRLLMMDGHGSHVTAEFDQYCFDNSIILLCMLPHSTYILQPLDVVCFFVLKRAYGS
jgi:hypothetical protein